ncbi:MAG: bifunctional 2',3'-cyclic-nucleotide 2'-phosphodiesterase/3'-nucleotidase [Sedimentitalea sp.]
MRLMATTDLHMNLTSYDYYADRPDPSIGLTRTASLIQQARHEAATCDRLCLLFDNGDALQGAPLGDFAREHPDRAHPAMRAFKALRYDAVGLGNHDFNYGLTALNLALRDAPCPVLSSNMRRSHNRPPVGFAPYAILERLVQTKSGAVALRIGVLSFLPPQTALWDAHLLRGQVEVDDILASARAWLPELAAAGCDLIVALAHSGLDGTPAHPGMENAAIPLAELNGIDAVVAGHTHLLLPGTGHAGLDHVDAQNGLVHGKPVVMAGWAGGQLGIIDLDIQVDDAGAWRVIHATADLRPIMRRKSNGQPEPLVQEDRELAMLLAADHADTQAMMNQPVGYSDTALHSYFTFFAPDRALRVVAAAQAAILRTELPATAQHLPILSAAAPSKFGARAGPLSFTDVPAGPLSLRHVADLHVFPNELCAVIATGAILRDWLEMSASLFHQISPLSEGTPLLDPSRPGHDFDVIFGLSYQIDLSQPARFDASGDLIDAAHHRIKALSWQGQPMDDQREFVVALNSYRASGGGRVKALEQATRIPLPPITVRAALQTYLAAHETPEPLETAPDPWRLFALPGTKATALTGPAALAYFDELDGRGIAPDGLTPDGFLKLVIPL